MLKLPQNLAFLYWTKQTSIPKYLPQLHTTLPLEKGFKKGMSGEKRQVLYQLKEV